MSRAQTRDPRKPRPLVLVFGESEHDRRSIKRLVEGLRPDLAGCIEERREPLVLIKNALPDKARSNAERISRLANTESKVSNLIAVLAHEDCDALEPAHVRVAERIEQQLRDAGCPGAIAVTPAWELETWWMIFPEAVGKVVKGWRDPVDWLGSDVGRVRDAKEALARAVRPRPARAATPRGYHERDSIAIANHIVEDALLSSFEAGRRSTLHKSGGTTHTRSASFEQFRSKVLAISVVAPQGRGRAADRPGRA